jgi:hypothetical protein
MLAVVKPRAQAADYQLLERTESFTAIDSLKKLFLILSKRDIGMR